jgi:glycerate-2-kinase
MIIGNRRELVSHGNVKGRNVALDVINYAMEAIDGSVLVRRLVCVDGDQLRVGSLAYDLSMIDDIYVVGAGKAVFQLAEGLEGILGDRIAKGIVIEKRVSGMKRGLERISRLERIEVLQGSHPIPDEAAVRGAEKILEIAKSATERDLVFSCTTGGCTCLTTLPAEGLSLEDVRETTALLLHSGAAIDEVNAVRHHITALSGGRLAKYIHPAEIVNLIVNDAVWRFPEGWRSFRALGWGPSAPIRDSAHNTTTAAVSVLKKYKLWDKVSDSVRHQLDKADPNTRILNARDFERMGIKYHCFVLADVEYAAEAAKKGAEEMGLSSVILSTAMEGEAREVGTVLAGIAKEIVKNGRPCRPPCVLIMSGETTVTIVGEHGKGGRNQECALSSALRFDAGENIVIASVSTDGTDGPTDAAGGIVDGYSMKRAKEKGIDIFENIQNHNSSHVLGELGDMILFNEPGTNVCDLMLIVVTS